MRLVIDTNIVVSALLKAGSVPAIVLRLATQSHVIIKSIETEHEARATVQRTKLSSLIAPEAIHWLDTILAGAEPVTIAGRYQGCCDTNDNKFIDLAVSGRADLIITGDADFLDLGAFRDIPIIAPVTFLRAYYPGWLA